MGRVAVGVEEADRERLDSVRDEVAPPRGAPGQVERHDHAPVAVQPLVDLAAEGTRDQRLREAQEQIVDVVALLGAHLEDVPEPARRQEPERAAGPLDDGVGDERGAVDEGAEVGEAEAGRRSSSSSPSSAPADGSLGVVRHLWRRTRPVSPSTRTKSVKVPPMSTPTR